MTCHPQKNLLGRNSQNRCSIIWQNRSWSPSTGFPWCRLGPSHPPSRHLWWHQIYCDANTTKDRCGCENINQWGRFIWFIIKYEKKKESLLTHIVFTSNVSHDGITLHNLPVSILQVGELQLDINPEPSYSKRCNCALQHTCIHWLIGHTYVGEFHSKCRFFIKPAALVIVWR